MNNQGKKANEECSSKEGETKTATNQTTKLNYVELFVSSDFVVIKRDIIPTMLRSATPFQSLLHPHHLYPLLQNIQITIYARPSLCSFIIPNHYNQNNNAKLEREYREIIYSFITFILIVLHFDQTCIAPLWIRPSWLNEKERRKRSSHASFFLH